MKKRLLPQLNELYSVIFDGRIKLTEDTLDNMIYDGEDDQGAWVRLNLVISLALPSITRMPIGQLPSFHERIQDLLRFV